MDAFRTLIESLGVGDDGISTVYPETFVADATAAYDSDLSIPLAKIDVLTAENAALAAENMALKAHNYELIVSQTAGSADGDQGDSTTNDESEDGNEEISDLFDDSNDDK